MMLHQLCGISQTVQRILARKSRVFLQHIFNRVSRRKKFNDGLGGNARALDRGQTIANIGVDDDPAPVCAHVVILSFQCFGVQRRPVGIGQFAIIKPDFAEKLSRGPAPNGIKLSRNSAL